MEAACEEVARGHRDLLHDQASRLEALNNLQEECKVGLEQRIGGLEDRIAEVGQQFQTNVNQTKEDLR